MLRTCNQVVKMLKLAAIVLALTSTSIAWVVYPPMIVGFNQSVILPNKSNDNCLPIGYDVPNSHSLFAGCVKRNDTLLFSNVVNKPAHWYKTNNKVLYYAPGYYRNTTITAIRCYDLRGNNSDSYANVLYGGVGYREAKIRLFNTMKNRKLNFRVEIYGHP